MRPVTLVTFLLYFFISHPFLCHAQEESTVVTCSKKYIDFKVKSLEKYNKRLERQQQRLLKKLKRKEARFATKLKDTDSLAYTRFKRQPLTFDSIGKISNADSSTIATSPQARNRNANIDSLKAIQAFAKLNGATASSTQMPSYDPKLAQLQGQLNYHNYINELITQRTNTLKNISASSNIPVFTGIEKQVYYARQKMGVFKEISEEPSKAEDKAYEYLQGTKGFDKYMDKASAGPNSMQSLSSNASAADLQKMGLQTKQQVQTALVQKFGGNLGGISQKMGDQIKAFQDKAQDINSAKQTLQSLKQIKNINKPSFKINPMRGLPFWKRIEKQYNFQTIRATIDGAPAILQLSAMAGYKQTPKLSYGVGLVDATGLGQNWSNVRFTFQGIGFRTYAAWQWQYGIGAYVGYERVYRQAAFAMIGSADQTLTPSAHNTSSYNESVLVGLTKSYHINDKWNGSIQLLYDIWWQQKRLTKPNSFKIFNDFKISSYYVKN